MTKTNTLIIALRKTYNTSLSSLFSLFQNSTVFQLTGANYVLCDFRVNGKFNLSFINRGTISGHFIKITDHEIVMEWNVEGFQRSYETGTIVEIALHEADGKCVLTLNHNNIINEESAKAKKRAWQEILDEIEKSLN